MNFFSFSLHDFGGGFKSVRFLVALAVGFLLLSSPSGLRAQALSGITGTVTDVSGGVVPDAKVTATNTATGVASHATTGSAGQYTITDLIPGNYTVKIERPGFQVSITKDVNVEVARNSTVDAVLKTGNASETMEVVAEAIALETSQPDIGTSFESKALAELPIPIGDNSRARAIDSFLFLTPGVTGDSFSHRISGGVDFQNEVVFNGVAAAQAETQGYQTNINPPFELVAEFRALSSVFSAQYGLAQGVASYQFASGTNALHGDVFEILKNNIFDARRVDGPTDPTTGKVITPVDTQHNYGFSLGGPVVLPKIYNGKNKTFFYVSLDWYRQNNAVNGHMSVPTKAMKGGDFSALVDPNKGNALIPIFAPANFTPPAGCGVAAGQQFPGNIIPKACMSTISQSILPLIPDPTGNGIQDNLNSQISNVPTRQTNYGFSIDHNLTDRQKIHGTFWRDKWNQPNCCDNNALFSNQLSGLKNEPRLGTGLFLSYSNALTSNLVMTAGFGWMGEINNELNTSLGYKLPAIASGEIFPLVTFGGDAPNSFTTWGAGNGGETFSLNRKLGVTLNNNWLYTHGRHTFNFGAEIRRVYQDDHECQSCGGQFGFSSNSTSNGSNTGATGNAFASFLLGMPDSASRQFAAESRLRNFYVAPYIQDNIKVTSKLTLDVGLRWDVMRPFTENNNNVVFFDPKIPNPGAVNPATGQPLLGAATKFGNCAGCSGYTSADMHWRNFGPRIGIAYKLNHKTVLLSGYALNFLDGGAYEFGTNKVANNYGNQQTGIFNVIGGGTNSPNFGSWDAKTMPVPTPLPFGPAFLNGVGINGFGRDRGFAPYLQNWNVGIQRELPWNMFFSASYVGNRGIHLPATLDNPKQLDPAILNQVCPGGITPGTTICSLGQPWNSAAGQQVLQARGFPFDPVSGLFVPYTNFKNDIGVVSTRFALRPFPMYSGVTDNFDNSGVDSYHSLQVTGQKRFTNGVSFLVAYTVSKTMSNTDSGFSTFNSTALDKFNKKQQWAVAADDRANILNISTVYELPIGPGKRFLNRGGLLTKNVLGGWQVSAIAQYTSGTPLRIGANGNPLGTGNIANLVPGVPFSINYDNYYKGLPVFNTKAFASPGTWVLGNAPRRIGDLRNPFRSNENIAFAKHFFFGEKVTAELRMEFFNLLNRMQICGPETNVNSGNFGIVNNGNGCQDNNPRQGQAYFKVNF
jgi:hypothetical protein